MSGMYNLVNTESYRVLKGSSERWSIWRVYIFPFTRLEQNAQAH